MTFQHGCPHHCIPPGGMYFLNTSNTEKRAGGFASDTNKKRKGNCIYVNGNFQSTKPEQDYWRPIIVDNV